MTVTVESPTGVNRWVWPLALTQLLVLAAYAYGAVAYLLTDAEYFPEQSPPTWAWPAVAAVALGIFPTVVFLALAVPTLRSASFRSAGPRWRASAAALVAASVVLLLVMATPPGWELFDWYVD
ncbi:hypothetical protein [Micromonospora endolithica]|uniref:Uncharacterized protein n=1 Tax=Micromonospora endolithica TaxID=230091 RepID=A0A3A9ZJE7_9ACTN|nr:hypothetical protein [Micromonospora endolithica]RKN48453.1 hypothetical protein D7223_10685 [Micromonospora endolithica]TWJ24466.1 hypothetical protein JD76_04616 [Micromonospora endolithica]